jgi:hypothetical protein
MSLHEANAFIAVSEDCPTTGEVPPARGGKVTAAEAQYRMLVEQPYRFTQEDVLFESSTAVRENLDLSPEEKAELRARFLTKSQACLRASPLPKRYGWGIHFDADGKAAAYARDSDQYRRLASDPSLKQVRGMRSKRP